MTLPIKIQLPDNYLNEEVRDDFLVSEKRKQIWAVELDLLSELDRVCQKNHLTYYLTYGSLLGAFRHKGFIPWDDDIDVIMPREDYEILKTIASKEFSNPYFFQTIYSDKEYFRSQAKLRNSETCAAQHWELKHLNTNEGIFIDIFPVDKIPSNKLLHYMYQSQLHYYWSKIKILHYYEHEERIPENAYEEKKEIARQVLEEFGSIENLFLETERLAASFSGKSDLIQPALFIIQNAKYYPDFRYSIKQEFLGDKNSIKRVPFEFLDFPIPERPEPFLEMVYGKEFMTPIKGASIHQTLLLDATRSFKELRNLYKSGELDEDSLTKL